MPTTSSRLTLAGSRARTHATDRATPHRDGDGVVVRRPARGRSRLPSVRDPPVERGALLERAAERVDDRAEARRRRAPGRGSAPAAREMFSSMSVPPRSLQPAWSAWRAPAMPALTHDTWMLSIQPRYAMRPTAWIEQHLAEGRARAATRCCRKIGRRHVHERERHELGEAARLLLQLTGAHQVPRDVHRALHVAEHDRDVRPQADRVRERGAPRATPRCSTLSGQMTARTSSSRISAAVPGQRGEPGVLRKREVRRASGMPSRRAPSVTSSAVKPCTWMSGADLLHRTRDRRGSSRRRSRGGCRPAGTPRSRRTRPPRRRVAGSPRGRGGTGRRGG